MFFYPHFSLTQKTILHLVLAVASVVFGWLALQYYKKAIPTGSNLGCLYYFFLLLNLVGGVGAVFFGLVQVFSAEGGSSETLWLL
ncbi:MAG TPA: hypothetical protein VFU15_03340 [Bacteroidia bacterium]|nr:hypothetical protein [Bacteroidia bacterium]